MFYQHSICGSPSTTGNCISLCAKKFEVKKNFCKPNEGQVQVYTEMTQSLKFRIKIVESVDVGYYVYYYLCRILTRIISTDVLYLSSALQRFEICLCKRFAIPAATHQQSLTFSFIYKIFVLYIKGSLRTAMRKDYKFIHILSFNRYAPLWRIHICYGRFW